MWILARAKLTRGATYYGAYPGGFLERARALVGATRESFVLHVCGGKVKNYPYRRGRGNNDYTLDIDPLTRPDYVQDAREPFPECPLWRQDNKAGCWDAILIDPPYTSGDAEKYRAGADVLPSANCLVRNAIAAVAVGHRIGILHYIWPACPPNAIEVACVGVLCGRNNRIRLFTVFERTK
jgi:hypothetical protein